MTAYVAGYTRTPFTFARKGALAPVRPETLGAHVIRALLEKTNVPGDQIEDVVWGCAFPEGEQGLNIGRVVALEAGLPVTKTFARRNPSICQATGEIWTHCWMRAGQWQNTQNAFWGMSLAIPQDLPVRSRERQMTSILHDAWVFMALWSVRAYPADRFHET